MNIFTDFHVHTIASGHHTSSTLTDVAREAAKRGLTHLGITDHAPSMAGAASESYFRNLRHCDKRLFGVNILYGVELNVKNTRGEVDLPLEILSTLDYSVASLHKDVFKPNSERFDTLALVNAAENKYVNVIGHPDDPTFSVNFDYLTDAALKTGTAIEFNAVSVSPDGYRQKNPEGLIKLLLLCKKKDIFVTLGSDSHGINRIADFSNCLKLLNKINFPCELLLNDKPELFATLVTEKRKK